jgi:hypothetical protein
MLRSTITGDMIAFSQEFLQNSDGCTPTFEVTSTPIQREYAEAAIFDGLVEMMSQMDLSNYC